MRYLSIAELIELHRMVIDQSGGSDGIRDLGGLESVIAQPRMTFDQRELYPSLEEKAAALCFSLVGNHPFVDGNKRVGHATMETFLVLNGHGLQASVDDAESAMLSLAAGNTSREELAQWIRQHMVPG